MEHVLFHYLLNDCFITYCDPPLSSGDQASHSDCCNLPFHYIHILIETNVHHGHAVCDRLVFSL